MPTFARCPKCGHSPLPAEQALPAACPACGVILAKVAQARSVPSRDHAQTLHAGTPHVATAALADSDRHTLVEYLFHGAESNEPVRFWPRVALLLGFTLWGVVLIAQDYRTGEIGASFIHRPLLIFHEAGHVIFRLFGQWVSVLGGTLGQLIMPLVLGAALLVKNRDPFGASIGLWFAGVSLLDIAPYMYDALHPQLMLLSGTTGEEGGHDWIYLFSSMGLLQKSQLLGNLVHKLGAMTVLLALAWGGYVLKLAHARR